MADRTDNQDPRRAAREWQRMYDPLAPKAGDVAPDFELMDADGEHTVRLSAMVGERPIVLVFGSYT